MTYNSSVSISAPWEGNPPQSEAARKRLVEAAGHCIARNGFAATSLGAIATEAGVSRQTVYRYFAGRDELVGTTMFAAAEGVRATIQRAIRDLTDPADMIVETLVLGLSEMRTNPVLLAIWDSSRLDGSMVASLTKPTGIAWTRETLTPAIEAAGWTQAETDPEIELILRIFLSLVVCPLPERTDDELRAFLYRHLIPGLRLGGPEKNEDES